jgi:hypothetical protein
VASPLYGLIAPVTSQPWPYNFPASGFPSEVLTQWPRILDGSYESKLLRVRIGYMHVSLLQQVALTQYGTGFHHLKQEEKNNLENDVLGAVFYIAHHLTNEALSRGLNPPSIN